MPYHQRTQRWACMVAHRRAGKTVACINDLIKRAIECPLPYARYAYLAPYRKQAKEVAWEYLKRYAEPIRVNANESDLYVELINGARIGVYGADNPDAMRGPYLDGGIADERAQMRPSVFGEVIRPMLADRQGWWTDIGTPQGRNAFHRVYRDGCADPARWFTLMLKASQTGILLKEELADARKEMTEEEYEQEFECSFDAAIKGAYYAKAIAQAEADGRVNDEVEADPELPVHNVWDLGMDDPTAIWFFQVAPDGIRVLGHYEANNTHLDAHWQNVCEIYEQHGWVKGKTFLPHDAKAKVLGMKRTRIEQLQGLGADCDMVPFHTIIDGINAVRMSFPRLWFHATRCEAGLEALRQYKSKYDEKLDVFAVKPLHDWTSHTADAMRYLAMVWRDTWLPQQGPQKPKTQDKQKFWLDESGQLQTNKSVWDVIRDKHRARTRNEHGRESY
jgi:phage terminase large subunit